MQFFQPESLQGDQRASQDIIQEEDSGDVCLCHQERASQVRWQQEARKTQEIVAPESESDDEMSVQVICACFPFSMPC
jgi:ABC-type sulfate transport system substrate-binding protein